MDFHCVPIQHMVSTLRLLIPLLFHISYSNTFQIRTSIPVQPTLEGVKGQLLVPDNPHKSIDRLRDLNSTCLYISQSESYSAEDNGAMWARE